MAARFTDRSLADRALRELRAQFDLSPSDVSLAPMGSSDQPAGSIYLLAGRFLESRVREVLGIVEGRGGVIVANVDEGWTRPRTMRPVDRGARKPALRHQPGRSMV